LVVVE